MPQERKWSNTTLSDSTSTCKPISKSWQTLKPLSIAHGVVAQTAYAQVQNQMVGVSKNELHTNSRKQTAVVQLTFSC